MRTSKGATLALVVSLLFLVGAIGVFLFFMGRMFAGAREVAHLTDAGGLNCGKQLITFGRPLNPGIEAQHFAYLIDTNGNVDLRVYNRIIAQTMLVGLNAQAEGTTQARDNANQLLYAVQGAPDSISKWLTDNLSQPSTGMTPFTNVADSGSVRMLGPNATADYDAAAYGVAYVNPGEATNVFLDPSILPAPLPSEAYSSKTAPNGLHYLAGYKNLDTGVFMIEGTPVMPEQQPHLIATRDFDGGAMQPITGSGGFVPPNSFRTGGSSTPTIKTVNAVQAHACSIVGALGTAFGASIPEGYLQVMNNGDTNGRLVDLLNNVNPDWASSVVSQMVQRMRETQPNATPADATALLNTVTVNSGETVYIYLNNSTNALTWSVAQPVQPVFGSGMTPDGNPQGCSNVQGGFTVASGTYTPSCGYNNLLGHLIVGNFTPTTTTTTTTTTTDTPPTDGGGGGDGGGGDGGGCGGDGGGDGGDGGD